MIQYLYILQNDHHNKFSYPSPHVVTNSFPFLGAVPLGMWDLSSLTRDRTHTLCIGSAREGPNSFSVMRTFKIYSLSNF